jgi:hypothetical protein
MRQSRAAEQSTETIHFGIRFIGIRQPEHILANPGARVLRPEFPPLDQSRCRTRLSFTDGSRPEVFRERPLRRLHFDLSGMNIVVRSKIMIHLVAV